MQKYQDFFSFQVYAKKSPDRGLTAAQSYEKVEGKPYQPPTVSLPKEVLRSSDVGMLCDPVESITLLIDYRQFIDVFRDPDLHLGSRAAEDHVLGYLESDSISDVPFRRVAHRFPANFKRVISYYTDQEGFISDRIDDLMLEFKPETFDKLPGIVTLLDSEMARFSGQLQKESGSILGRFKGLFK